MTDGLKCYRCGDDEWIGDPYGRKWECRNTDECADRLVVQRDAWERMACLYRTMPTSLEQQEAEATVRAVCGKDALPC